ncbi:MAG TPA: peptide chain release factor N(5)-glutamine methyltransferase [Pyrinomonadaceae bacterium]|nr:peptide chain release factor N(5)-glutamine methyltransferase [Pyrinomonadaceae bacterium]
MSLSISEALRKASEALSHAGVPEARKEARSLLAHVLDVDRTVLITEPDKPIAESSLSRFQQLVARRTTGEPAQYITGSQDFYGRRFEVTPDVLIPRPETEGLIETTVPFLSSAGLPFWICDVGTGSGCIAITLLCENPFAHAIGVDISEAALGVAKRNAKAHDVANRISFIRSDCFDALTHDVTFDLIVSNPPYVSSKVLPGLQREVREHEPRVALTPGDDGLAIIRRLINEAPPFLKPGGRLVIEIGFDQSDKIPGLLPPKVWQLERIESDLQQIPRIVVLKKLPHDDD